MNSVEEIITKIEKDLQITFNKSLMSSCYFTKKGIIEELSITNVHFENLDALSPLFESLKKLEIQWECTFNEEVLVESLMQFKALEELSVSTTSVQTANGILCLKNLKKLNLWLSLETNLKSPFVLDLGELQNVQDLLLSCQSKNSDHQFIVKKAGQPQYLKKLALECDCQFEIEGLESLTKLEKLFLYEIDIKSIPNIQSLKTLSCSHRYEDAFNSEGKFPNLKNLKIDGFTIVKLGKLPKLKILVMGARDFDLENADCFDHLPNLEQLSLTWCDIKVLKKIGQLKKLKMLDLSENKELINIDELESLKELECLNLYDNKISDIRVLNKLPNLKLVDLAKNNISKEEVNEQLDKPEIACFMGVPHVPFIIGGSKIF